MRATLPTHTVGGRSRAAVIVWGMSETGTADAPGPIFSPEDGLAKLWAQAYQGEVLGERLFGRLAEHLDARHEAEHAAKMRVLATLERLTKEAVAPALEKAGISTEPDAEMLGAADSLADASRQSTWEEVMGSFEAITGQFIGLYRRIGELDPTEKDTAELLVAHEVALRDFARSELAGRAGTSLDPVNALAHMH
jgi:hypothetical protein